VGWFYVICGGVFEVSFTTCLRYADGFKNLPWTLGFLACIAASMYFLDMSLRTIPIGTAYAVWTGIGALGTVVIGMCFYGEPTTLIRISLIFGLVSCVAGLKITSGH
jgi:quaternary ammonium compound-resistance protein SugE